MNVQQQTIVVGYDSSPESYAALSWARRHAGPDDRIVLLYAWEVPIVVGYDVAVVIDVGEIEVQAQRMLDDLIAAEGDDRLDSSLRRGHAGRALVAECEEADLVVVGHRGESRMSMLLGSTANYVIHHTDRPVVVIRGAEVTSTSHVVVGVDEIDGDDDPSVRALRWALHVPGIDRVTVVHGWSLPPLAVAPFDATGWNSEDMDDLALEAARRALDAAGPVPDGVDVTCESGRGNGAFVLIDRSKDADLVVVGRRGRGGVAEMLLGSTSAVVAAHAHSPVAIVR